MLSHVRAPRIKTDNELGFQESMGSVSPPGDLFSLSLHFRSREVPSCPCPKMSMNACVRIVCVRVCAFCVFMWMCACLCDCVIVCAAPVDGRMHTNFSMISVHVSWCFYAVAVWDLSLAVSSVLHSVRHEVLGVSVFADGWESVSQEAV